MPKPVIETVGLTKVFRRTGVAANRDMSLSIQAGDIVGLLGPNGAGKTTFVRMVMGLLRPTAGSVFVLGVDVQRYPTFPATKIGYYGQRALYLWSYKARELIYHTARLRGIPSAVARRATDDLIETFGMEQTAGRLMWHLSGGQARLVALCAALVGTPSILVLDEPTNELDPALRQRVWTYLLDLSQHQGVTILLVTHNIHEAERVLDRVVILDAGEVRATGTPGDLRRRLGDEVRLELKVVGGIDGARAFPDILGQAGAREVRRDVWWVYAAREMLPALLERVLSPESQAKLEDYRIVPPSLEDVYVRISSKGWE